MIPALTPESKSFWEKVTKRQKEYPFWCATGDMQPRPENIAQHYWRFHRISFNGRAYWGFKEHEKRNEFTRRYDAQPWAPG